MYSGIKNIKVNNRNRSSSYFSKRCSSNANTKNSFGLSKLAEEDQKLKLKLTPLLISSTSWIVVSPNEMDSFKSGFNLNVKRDKCINGVKISRSSINNNSNFFKNCYMYGNKWAKQREIASLTKIMTCYTVLKLIERYKLNKHMTLVTVSKRASCEVGTTAHLEEGHSFSVWDLLHALMLPSGNDAAIALAEHFGNFLINEDEKELNTKIFIKRPLNDISTTKDIRSVNESDYIVLPEIKIRQDRELLSESCLREPKCLLNHAYGCDIESSYSLGINSCSMSYSESFSYKDRFKSLFKDSKSISRFIKKMNSDAKKIKLNNTHFDSPHGLSNSNNVSTAYDIALLCSVCVRNLDFSRITRTKSYVCKSRNNIGVQLSRVVTKDYTWANTNKLLEEGFIGIKTGVTYPAGPCFAAHLKSKNRSFIVVLLNCGSLEQRFTDAKRVIEHCNLKISYGMTSDMKPIQLTSEHDIDSLSDSFNLSQSEMSYSQKGIDSTPIVDDRHDEDFFKTSTDNLNKNSDEDGSTTLSSSSPVCSFRKSLQIDLAKPTK